MELNEVNKNGLSLNYGERKSTVTMLKFLEGIFFY